jgi:sugar lactone lactonase YvrE
VRFTISVPKATGTASTVRRPRYVSPATASVTIAIVTDPGGVSVVSETVALTPTSAGCSSTLASTQCTLSLALNPGSYDASVSTADAGGTTLSQGQVLDFTIAQGQQTTVPLTLSGVPAALVVQSAAAAVHGTQNTGFTLYGISAQKLQVEALDADGNAIVGVGSPTFTVASASGSGFTIANPTTSTPNTVTLTPPGTNGTVESFALTAAAGDGACSLTGAVCSANFAVKNDIQTLFIANYDANNIFAYAPPYTSAPTTISNGVNEPYAMVMDPADDLFVSNYGNNTVTEYAPPYTTAPVATMSTGLNGPSGLAIDASGNVFVANSNANSVEEFAPPYNGAPVTISTGVDEDFYVAVDASDNVFVANYGNNTVTEYALPYGSPTQTITNGVTKPSGLALNAMDDLFVVDFNGPGATEYAPPYSGAPTTLSSGLPGNEVVAVDPTGNVYVASNEGDAIVEFAPPYTGTPLATITNAINSPVAIVFDGANNMIVANVGRANVTAYAPPYTGAPLVTISGLNGPQALLLTP